MLAESESLAAATIGSSSLRARDGGSVDVMLLMVARQLIVMWGCVVSVQSYE